MTRNAHPPLDARYAHDVVRDALVRRTGYLPTWLANLDEDDPAELARTPDAAYLWIVARYLETLIQRLDRAPDKSQLAFLETVGIELIPAVSARTAVVFRTSPDAPDHHLSAGTRLLAPPPPESGEQVTFEVERGTGLASAQVRQCLSLWPGRDQYIDHSSAIEEGETFHPFRLADLQDTPHHLYIGHDRLLALDGHVTLEVEFELLRPSSEPLDIAWEYWDGEVWRGFRGTYPLCAEEERADATAGLVRSGVVRLESDCAESKPVAVAGTESSWIRGRLIERMLPSAPANPPAVSGIRISTRLESPLTCGADPLGPSSGPAGAGRLPDLAVAGGAQVEVTEPFFPFGEQPQPGSTFYFALDEIFARPGAEVEICVTRAQTPQDELAVATEAGSAGIVLPHLVAWEFWDGGEWRALFDHYGNDPVTAVDPRDFTKSGVVEFTVPGAIRATEVDGEEAFWIRIRLLSGGFGFTQRVTWLDGTDEEEPVRHEFTYVVTQPPALRDLRLGYTWQDGPYEADHVVAYNDFQYETVTAASRWEGGDFIPYRAVGDLTPALYLGFDRPLPVDRLGFFVDVAERPDALARPELVWEYYNGSTWAALSVEDGTRHLGVTGMVSPIGPGDSEPLARFGRSLHWMRGRLKKDGPPGSPELRRFHPNAVWAVERETIGDEPLGSANGLPHQVVVFPRIPVLPGERIEVRELEGARADVEWRIVAMELFDGDLERVRAVEDRVGASGSVRETVEGDLRLVRDRERRVVEVWVRWSGRRHLYTSGPDDRHYLIERARGRVRFGDGVHGRLPPRGAAMLARTYRSGGGRRGNVPARAISQAAAGLGGVEELFNPLPASGGAEAETARAVAFRGPRTLRHRSRAVRVVDYETMAREASAAVAVARALPLRDPAGRPAPGWLTLLLIPESDDARPWPSFQLREHVRRHICEHAGPQAGFTGRLNVTGPTYHAVDVRAEIGVADPQQAGPGEEAVRAAIERFLNPLRGGPSGDGWTMGRDVFLSDLAATIERVEGVDHVGELSLMSEQVQQGERLRVPADRVVAAGKVLVLVRS